MIRENEALSNIKQISWDELPQVFHPWRRFLARSLDMAIYSTLWKVFLMLVIHVNMSNRGSLGNIFDGFISIAIMLFLEPLWLSLLRTTPGKAIFGLRIEAADGNRLSYSEGLERTWGVVGAGMGYNIPIYSIVRCWKSYKICKENETQPWDRFLSYTIKDTKWYRGLLMVGATVVLGSIIFTATSLQQLPPNRGDLTVTEFADNFNYYSKHLDIVFDNRYLDSNGKWSKNDYIGGSHYSPIYNELPEYQFVIENGSITGISFIVELNNNQDWIHTYSAQMVLASLSFAGAQKETDLFSKKLNKIAKQISSNPFKNFSFIESGIKFTCDTEYTRYITTNFLVPDDDATDNYFKLQFSMNKLE